MIKRGKMLSILLLCAFVQLLVLAQVEMPWFWDFDHPSTFTDIDLVNCPANHSDEFPLDFFEFETAAVDVRDGSIVPCDMSFRIYFSTEGVTDPNLLTMWQGGHMHQRQTDKAHRRVTLGEIETVPASDDTNPATTEVQVRIENHFEKIKVLRPEAAGVIKIRADSRTRPNLNYCGIENEYWHKAPDNSNPNCWKHAYGEWAEFFLILGLQELPESGDNVYYRRDRIAEGGSNPYHPNPLAYYGTQGMINAVMRLAKNYYEDEKTKEQKLKIKDMSLKWGGDI